MSYDIKIWSINKVNLPESLPEKEMWELSNGNAYFETRKGQIVVNESAKVEDEDINPEVIHLLPGISYLTEINLERSTTFESEKSLLLKISKAIAKNVVGVIDDPQGDNIISPSGVSRFIQPKRERDERFSLLAMNWWFVDNPLSNEEILTKLVDYFEKNLPEALPRRYGECEPPPYKYSEEGKNGFMKYLYEHMYESNVLYPTRPVSGINFSFCKDWGFYYGHEDKKYFAANNVSLDFDSSVLNQPGWKKQLQKVFKDISVILKPFYGEARILHNYIYARGTYYLDSQSEENPINGRWMGIPQKLGQAVVIGKPYLEYFSKVKEKGIMLDSMYFLSTEDWASGKNLNDIIGNVPQEIRQIKPRKLFFTFRESLKKDTDDEKFPPIFPFYKEAKK